MKPCEVKLSDILHHDYCNSKCYVSKCNARNCKTCHVLNTSSSFTSALTLKTYTTQGYGNFNCSTSNVVYGITCSLCGLIYVGETKGPLNKRINGHRYQINNNGNQLLYRHFNQPDHSILTMGVVILEKIYHHTNSPTLSTPYRRQREEFWIKELGTASPYGCNDNITGVGNLSSPNCSQVNVMNLFPVFERRRRSHGHRHYTPVRQNSISFWELLNNFDEPLGIHHIRTKLFALPLTSLHRLFDVCLDLAYFDQSSNEYRLKSIILDIANSRLYKPVSSINPVKDTGRFMTIKYANKGIDAINISRLLHHRDVKAKIPAYFNDPITPRLSYSYTRSIASKVFNYKHSLKDFNIEQLPSCSCSTSPFLYQPAGHVVTGDLNIVENPYLKDILSKGPKYREARPFSWKYNFKLVMDAVEQYAKDWARREEVEVDCLSEWVKSIRRQLQRRIYMASRSVNTRPKPIFDNIDVIGHLADLHDQYVIVPADKASNNIVFICKAYFYSCLIEELGIKGNSINTTYERSNFQKEDILANHKSVISSFGITTKDSDLGLPYLYWIPKLHKNPYKQ